MAGSINKVILVGNLGREPEIRTMQSGDRVCTLSLATSDRWKDKSTGEQKERTEWHRIVLFSQGLVNVAEKYLNKGTMLYVEGQLQTRKWSDNQGVEKYTTEVVIQGYSGNLTILGGRGESSGSTSSGNHGGKSSGGGFGQGPNDSYGGGEDRDKPNFGGPDLDDEIPF